MVPPTHRGWQRARLLFYKKVVTRKKLSCSPLSLFVHPVVATLLSLL